MTNNHLLFCSFYTDDEYYSSCATRLRERLDQLGVKHRIEPITKPPGVEWPEICRQKIPFMHKIFNESEFKRLVWIDVDCYINRVPEFLLDYEADLMAFRRGFPSSKRTAPTRTRHWEPCFVVFNKTLVMGEFLAYAAELEAKSKNIRATDDYFFEEAWRKFSPSIKSFQIPGEMCSRHFKTCFDKFESRKKYIFFEFGASGQVAEFKGKVVQHVAQTMVGNGFVGRIAGWLGSLHLRLWHHKTAVNATLAPQKKQGAQKAQNNLEKLVKKVRVEGICALNDSQFIKATGANENERELVKSLFAYEGTGPNLALHWFIRPAPGNMGDWLSPYVVNKVAGRGVKYAPAGKAELFAIGSIGKLVGERQYVWGTGMSTEDTAFNPKAVYLAVRGPHTRAAVLRSGGVCPEVFGDPGYLMNKLYTPQTPREKGRFGLVRHYVHQTNALQVHEDIDDINILVSSPRDLELFIDRINRCEAVITSSLHVTILCHAYGIPCRLITFVDQENLVHGDGIKYRDYFEGAGVKPYDIIAIGNKVRGSDVMALAVDERPVMGYADNLIEPLIKTFSVQQH